MQYAEVIVDRRTSLDRPTFTYRIPPALLAGLEPGALLEVPFGKENILALLQRLVRRAPREELRPIRRVINAAPLLPPHLFRLAEQLSAAYLEPFSKILFFMLPPLPKRQPALPPLPPTSRPANQKTRKPELLIAPRADRFRRYLTEIKQTFAAGRSAILLVPDTTARYLPPFIEELQRLHLQPTIMSGALSPRERYLRWLGVRTNPDPQIVIGSFHAAFAPLTNLGLIIVEDEAHPLYKSERSPRLHLREAALRLAEVTRCHALLGSSLPSLESFLRLRRGRCQLLARPVVHWPNQLRFVNVGGRDRLSATVVAEIGRVLNRGGSVALFINRVHQRPCDQCGEPLRPEAASCPRCGRILNRFTLPAIRRELIRAFPESELATVAKGEPSAGEAKLLIGTRRIVELDRFDLGVVCLSELGLHMPDFRAEEYTLRRLIEFLEQCDAVSIQQAGGGAAILSAIGRRSLTTWLQGALRERLDHRLPPTSRLLSLVYTLTAQGEATANHSTIEELKSAIERALVPLKGSIIVASQTGQTLRVLAAFAPDRSPTGLKKFIAETRPSLVTLDP